MCQPITRDLPANKTYPKRRYSFLATPGTEDDGKLLVCEGKRGWPKVRAYLVREEPGMVRGGRQFILAKLDDEGLMPLEFYECILLNPQDKCCTCEGFRFFGNCTHLECLTDLLSNTDELPDPMDSPLFRRPADRPF